MRILLTGATGFIGISVAHRLNCEGLRPRLMARRPLRGGFLKGLNADFVQGDLESPKSLARAVEGADAVLHLAGRATFERYEVVAPTIVGGAETLMRAAAAAGVKTFVFASSLLVYGSQDAPVDAATPPRPRLGYARAKVEAEQRLGEIASRHGMNLAVLRLPHVYGVRDLLFANIRTGRTISPGLGDNRFARLHVDDCAAILVAAARQGLNVVSPVADDHSATWNAFFDVVRDYYPRFREHQLPAPLAMAGAFCLEQLARLRGVPTVYTPDGVRGWNLNVPVAPGLVWKDLGLTLTHPTIHEGVPATLDDCVAYRWLHPLVDRC